MDGKLGKTPGRIGKQQSGLGNGTELKTMDKINNQDLDLVLKSLELTATSQQSLQPVRSISGELGLEETIQALELSGAPRWMSLILRIAQDKRNDLAPHAMRYWKDKLRSFSDDRICDALMAGVWEFFPQWIR